LDKTITEEQRSRIIASIGSKNTAWAVEPDEEPAAQPDRHSLELALALLDAPETLTPAERLYRPLMKCDPADATPPFNLGNMLRANGRKVEAEAALRAATRADPTFAEAWYNLPTCWTSRADQKPLSIVCAVRYEPRRTTPMPCSILRCCCSEATSTRRRQGTGDAISSMTPNLSGQHGRGDP
jgi:hypothetical protein